MPGLSNPDVVDFVTVTPDGATCCLYVVETEPWPDRPDAGQLNAKLLNYVEFAVGGQLAETYPQAAGLPVRIVIDAYFDLAPAAVADLQTVERALAQYGIGLRWNDGLILDKAD